MQASFISGGGINLRRAAAERIRREVMAEYADALGQAGTIRRVVLRIRVWCEVRRARAASYRDTIRPTTSTVRRAA